VSDLKVRMYTLKTCSTCRKAVKWLKERGVEVEQLPVRESPPDRESLASWMTSDNLKPYLNTSSKDYRSRGLSGRQLTLDEALDEIEACPNLIKRPLTVWGDEADFGFKEARFEERLAALMG